MPTSRGIPFQGRYCSLQPTVPLETNIKDDSTQKMNKYKHFITDITIYITVFVHPFEIGSRYLTIK